LSCWWGVLAQSGGPRGPTRPSARRVSEANLRRDHFGTCNCNSKQNNSCYSMPSHLTSPCWSCSNFVSGDGRPRNGPQAAARFEGSKRVWRTLNHATTHNPYASKRQWHQYDHRHKHNHKHNNETTQQPQTFADRAISPEHGAHLVSLFVKR
jgi:hypothetical protein